MALRPLVCLALLAGCAADPTSVGTKDPTSSSATEGTVPTDGFGPDCAGTWSAAEVAPHPRLLVDWSALAARLGESLGGVQAYVFDLDAEALALGTCEETITQSDLRDIPALVDQGNADATVVTVDARDWLGMSLYVEAQDPDGARLTYAFAAVVEGGADALVLE